MRKPSPRVLVSVALLFCSACASDPLKDEPVVKKLRISGAEQVSAGDLKKKILTSQSSLLSLTPFVAKKHFDPNVWRTDLKRIERYYKERGFYQAVVAGEEIKVEGKNVFITLKVIEGKPTLVSEVKIDGLGELPAEQREELLDDVPLAKNDVFVEERWEGLKEQLTHALRELGYEEAHVEGQTTVDLETQRAEVAVSVDPGQRYKFGGVTVKQQPNALVEPWRIQEQAEEAIEDETWFSESGMQEAQGRVFQMGVFGAAKVGTGEPDRQAGTVPLEVEVQESAFHTVRAGIGFGFEQLRNDGHLIGEYTDRNFLGGLRRLDVDARAGWAFIPNIYSGNAPSSKNGPIARLTGELTQPRLWSPNFSLQTRLQVERELEPAYSDYNGKVRVAVPWRPWTWLTLTPSYNFELYKLDSTRGGTEVDNTSLGFSCGAGSLCLLSYLEQNIELDRRDNRQQPKRGYLLGVAFQEGGGPLGGSFDYLRVLPEARAYVSMLDEDKLTFSAKVRFGSLHPLKGRECDSPIVARFFSGGDAMRGFSTRRLSPMALVDRQQLRRVAIPTEEAPAPPPSQVATGACPEAIDPPDSGEGEVNAEPLPIGGNGLFESQFEVRYDLAGPLTVATFFDTGFVTTEQLRLEDIGLWQERLLMAVGAGVRYRTPVGPIRLDFGYRLNVGRPLQVYPTGGTLLTYESSQGCFGIGRGNPKGGGAPEGPCSIHLSIGEAF